MNGILKIIGSHNQILPLGKEYRAELIEKKLIVNSREVNKNPNTDYPWYRHEPILEEKVLTLDIKNVNICDNFVHVDTWFVDEELNGGRMEFKLTWT